MAKIGAPRRKSKEKTAPAEKKEPPHSVEKGVEDFAEEMGAIGERFGKRVEKKADSFEGWFRSTFGVVGPLVSSVFGLLLLSLFIWVLSIINIPVGSGLLSNIHYFFLAHIGWFFLIFLFFSYTSYMSKALRGVYCVISPIVSAAGITIAIWLISSVIKIANISLGISALAGLTRFLDASLFMFFYLFAFLGYLVVIGGFLIGKARLPWRELRHARPKREAEGAVMKAGRKGKAGRLYRSGRDRILGGVCGGIAEYLGTDPVIIRFIWIVASLAWGSGILLYIIMWIIMPRNPSDKWD